MADRHLSTMVALDIDARRTGRVRGDRAGASGRRPIAGHRARRRDRARCRVARVFALVLAEGVAALFRRFRVTRGGTAFPRGDWAFATTPRGPRYSARPTFEGFGMNGFLLRLAISAIGLWLATVIVPGVQI